MSSRNGVGAKVARRAAATVLWASIAWVAIAGVWLAGRNVNPGTPDSSHNLATARNLVEGHGFTSAVVYQYFVDQPLRGPETVRPPGIPFLLALCFLVTGVNLAAPVMLNAVFAIGSALCLRGGLRNLGSSLLADVLASLALLSGAHEFHSIWNNGALVFFTMLLFWLGTGRLTGRIPLRAFAILAGLVAAAGFLTKQTFLFTAVPTSLFVVLLGRDLRGAAAPPIGIRLAAGSAMLGVLVFVSSPYWIRNLLLFGDPVFNPMTSLRVLARYGGESGIGIWPSGTWRSVRFAQPLGLGELADAVGLRWLLDQELCLLRSSLEYVARINPVVTGLAAVSTLGMRFGNPVPYAFVLLLLGESIFSVFYISVSHRYLWPAYSCLLLLVGLGLGDLERSDSTWLSSTTRRAASLAVAVLLCAAVLFGARVSLERFAAAHRESRRELPTWIEAVNRHVPPDAAVVSQKPWAVWWFTGRASVMAPSSSRGGLLEVLQRHRPTYYLTTRPEEGAQPPPFKRSDLEELEFDPSPRPTWKLRRIRSEVFELEGATSRAALPFRIPPHGPCGAARIVGP